MKVKKAQAQELKNWAQGLANVQGRKIDEVMSELTTDLKDIIKMPILKSFDDDAKVEHALRILKAKHATPLVRRGREVEMLVLDFTKPKHITPKDKNKEPYDRADVYGLGVLVDEEAKDNEKIIKFCQLPLFDKSTALSKGLERGTTVKFQATAKITNGIFDLGCIEGSTKFTESEEQLDAKPEEVLQELFKLVPIADAEFNTCNKKIRGDLRLIRGDVLHSGVHTSEGGYTYGRYTVIDDSLDVDDVKKTGGLSIMVDKSQVLYDVGSSLYFLGQIDKNQDGRLGMTASVVWPLIPIPREATEEEAPAPKEAEEEEELGDEKEVELGSKKEAEEEEEQEEEKKEEVEAEPEEEPEEKPKAKSKAPVKPETKPKSKTVKKKEEDDDDEGGSIDLGDD